VGEEKEEQGIEGKGLRPWGDGGIEHTLLRLKKREKGTYMPELQGDRESAPTCRRRRK